jgi:O-antigen/teichoic acid export membrane protein
LGIRQSLAWSFLEEFGKKVLRLAGSVVIARLLTPSEVGVFALAMAAYALVGAIKQFGISSYLVREHTLTDDKLRSAFGVWLVVCSGLAVVAFACRGLVAEAYDTPGIAAVLSVIAVTFLLTPFGEPARALLMRDMRFDLLSHINLTSSVAQVSATIALAVAGWSYMALAWGMLFGTLVQSVLLLAMRPRHITMRPTLTRWREIAHFGGWLTGASVAGNVTSEGQKFVLGGFLGPAAVALFDRAVQVPSIFRMSLIMPVGRVLFPAFADDIRQGRRIGPKVEMLVAFNTILVWPAFAVAGVVAEPLIVFVFGAQWRIAGEILPYLLVAHAMLALLPQPEQILVPHGRVKRVFWVRAFAVVNGLGFAALGAVHSLPMVAYLRPVATVLFIAVLGVSLFRLMDVEVSRLARAYAKAATTAAVCATPAYAVARASVGDVPATHLLAGLAAAAPLWLLTVFALRHPIAREIEAIVRQAWRRGAGMARASRARRQ